jgi:hypothetical protein
MADEKYQGVEITPTPMMLDSGASEGEGTATWLKTEDGRFTIVTLDGEALVPANREPKPSAALTSDQEIDALPTSTY